jgi:ABC-type multidrug transport system fused ATPase/permease subunit
MRDFFKTVIFYIKPYKIQAALNIFLNLLSSIFSLFSLVLLIPFLGILFGTEEPVLTAPKAEFSADLCKGIFLLLHESLIQESGNNESGKIKALLFVSVFVLQ